MLIAIATKPLGLLSQTLIAGYFGASGNFDAYNFALFLVTFLGLTVSRVFSTVAIPLILKEKKCLSPDHLAGYQNFLITIFFLPVLALLVWLIFYGEVAVSIVGAKLPLETQASAYRFVRLMAVPAILMSFVGVLKPILNLNKNYRVPASLPAIHVLCIIFSVLVFHGHLDVFSLAVGFALSYSIQTPLILFQGFRTGSLKFVPFYIPRGTISILAGLSWMIVLTQTVLMFNTFVDKWFATGLEAGSISSLTYSMIIVNFGLQIFSQSLIVIMFTKMTELFSAGAISECDSYIRENLFKVTNLVVPACAVLFLASPEIVKILFQRGAFDEIAAVRTSGTLAMYMLGLPAMVINSLVSRVFHSLQKLKEKIWLAIQYLVTNIVGNYFLVKTLGTMGLAISSSLAINIHLFLSFWVLMNYRNGLKISHYFKITIRAYALGGVSIGAAYLLNIDSWLWGLLGNQPTVVYALLVTIGKTIFIFGIYGVGFIIFNKLTPKRHST
jgi:putative peptidoglycan lipid II flippase